MSCIQKTAIVTGSSQGIGAGLVEAFLKRGYNVIANSRKISKTNPFPASTSLALVDGDIGHPQTAAKIVETAVSRFGRVDILINNAAIRPHKPFTELTMQDWEAVRGVVLDGALYLTRALIEPMVKNGYGRILFFTGEGAFVGGSGRAHVSAAKMGLVGFARGLASEFATHNIRVKVVSPGSIDTMRANPEWYQGRTPNAAGIPLGRQGAVDEIAATCLFLVSDDGGFITGQTIHVNGGTGYY